jgi:hypothetical protein
MIEGPGSRRPKNIWIRIRNTAFDLSKKCTQKSFAPRNRFFWDLVNFHKSWVHDHVWYPAHRAQDTHKGISDFDTQMYGIKFWRSDPCLLYI